MLLAVYISMSSIGLDVHVQVHYNVKKEKAVFHDVMIILCSHF